MICLDEFTEDNWIPKVIESPDPVLVDFRTPGPPPAYPAPFLEQLCEAWNDRLTLGYVDVAKLMPIALFHRIHELPTLCLFEKGRIVKVWVGPDRMKEMFETLPYRPSRPLEDSNLRF